MPRFPLYWFVAALAACLLLPAEARAQQRGEASGSVSGTVVEGETGEAIASATVALYRLQDTTLVTGAVTDPDGTFALSGLRPGGYQLRVSFVGFRTERRDVTLQPQNMQVDVGTLRLGADEALLEGVEVSAQREQMEVQIDRTVYRPAEQPAVQGGTGADVLRQVPSIEIDIDGNISLRGNQDVAVLVNGRPMTMSAEMLAGFLESLPANAIERVEVIPNPSASFDPEGMGGIVNIVLKRDADIGWSGGVTVNGSTNEELGVSGTVGLGRGPLSVRLNAGLRRDARQTGGTSERIDFDAAEFYSIDQIDDGERNALGGLADLTIDYAFTDQTRLGLNTLVNVRDGDASTLNTYTIRDPAGGMVDVYERQVEDEGTDLSFEAALTGEHVFRQGHDLKLEASYEREREEEMETYVQIGALDDLMDEKEREEQDEKEQEGELRLDYRRPLSSNARLEAGYNGEWEHSANSVFADTLDLVTGRYRPNSDFINDFTFGQQVHAFYTQGALELGPWGFQTGLRAEQVFTLFEQEAQNVESENDYFSLYPSAFATYDVTESWQVKASYSKRVRRPPSRWLNPIRSQQDNFSQRVGNPDLGPEYTHSFEAGLVAQPSWGTVTVTPYFRRTVDKISRTLTEEVLEDGTRIRVMSFANLDSENTYGAEATAALRTQGRLNGYANVNAYRFTSQGAALEDAVASDGIGWTASLNGTYELRSSLTVQANVFYRAPFNIAGGQIDGFWHTTLAVRQDLFDGRASLTLRASDPFDTSGFSLYREDEDEALEFERRWDARSFELAFNWTFGQERPQRRDNRRGPQGDEGEGEGFGF